MCLPGALPASPATAAEALSAIKAGFSYLNAADLASLTTAEQADCLLALERAESMQTAARARVLVAFHAQGGYRDDGHGSARAWLRWRTQISSGAAADALRWMRRLSAHPAVGHALATAEISESFARQICAWTDLLPEDCRGHADRILLGAAAAGAQLRKLGELAEEIRRRTARPDPDDDGFDDRGLYLGRTFRGAGTVRGDLTPPCAAALAAVLEALGKRAGPEDLRSKWQRQHDALEEAMRRLIAAGGLPERGGQPTQIVLHLGLDQLRGLPGASAAEAAWVGEAAGPGYDCDATIVPVVTGRVDTQVLDQLAAWLLYGHDGQAGCDGQARPSQPGRTGRDGQADEAGQPMQDGQPSQVGQASHASNGQTSPDGKAAGHADHGEHASQGDDGEAAAARRQLAEEAVRQILIARAADLLSGPGGLAAWLRTGLLDGPAASVSLPLDTGAATETIPAHLRRAVIARDGCCRFPGCDQPAMACQPHHIIPRSQGGPTSLTNLLLLCSFHHLIAVHRWGWGIVLLPDGTVIATSPDRSRTLRSHGPPSRAA
jgi:Domain of unknown function (DUF222)/HNH endonuclease